MESVISQLEACWKWVLGTHLFSSQLEFSGEAVVS
jgi:hypothetical protein